MLTIKQIPVLNDNYVYLIHEPESGATGVVDPAVTEPVVAALNQHGWRLSYILNTHHHWDHVGANLELKKLYSCDIYGSRYDQNRIPGIDYCLEHGEALAFGKTQAQIIATPGHTLGHIVYHFAEDQALFCGDTLFVMGCGRLFEGSAEQMYQSLQLIAALPVNTRIYCAHEYTQNNGRFALTVEPNNQDLIETMQCVDALRAQQQPTVPSTIEQELNTNPFLRCASPEIRQHLTMTEAPLPEVFAEVRRRKDRF